MAELTISIEITNVMLVITATLSNEEICKRKPEMTARTAQNA